jgi:anti-sigma factor RsiW
VTRELEQLSCQELVELITDYLEGALPEEERARFEEHVGRCDGCRAYVEQMRTTIGLVGRLSSAAVTPEAEQALLAAFRDWKSR